MATTLNLGYQLTETRDIPLFIPSLKDRRGEFTHPIGGRDRPFKLVMQSKSTDAMKKALDRLQDETVEWFEKNSPETPEKERTAQNLAFSNFDVLVQLIEPYVMTAVVDWVNPPAYDEDGNLKSDATYDAELVLQMFREEPDLMMQAYAQYGKQHKGKFLEISDPK